MSLLSKKIALGNENSISTDEIRKVQINISIYVIIIGFIRSFQLANLYISSNKELHLIFTILGLSISSALMLTLLFKPKHLSLVIHISLLITFIDLLNKTVLLQEFYITHFQVIFMMIVWSLYGLGRSFGIVYSILFSSIIFIYIYLYGTSFKIFPDKSDPNFYLIWITYYFNIILFIWSHYYYYDHLKQIIGKKRKINKELSMSLKNTTKFSDKVTSKLNSPLYSIIKISNGLLEKNYNEANRKNLELLKFSSESLLEIINHIQYYSKIDKKDREEKSFDLAALLNNIVEAFQVKTLNSNIQLSFEYPEKLDHILIISDKNQLMQILYNLLGNAIKFTPNDGKITLRVVELYHKSKSRIRLKFSVKDNGIGIESNKVNDIFKPFNQADNSITRKYGGTGLGLSIVQKALSSLDSDISVKSEYNKGSTFTFEIIFRMISKLDIPNNSLDKKLSES